MGWDAHKNLAVATVATAPSPATSGTSLVVTSGQGARFPATPFNAVIWPAWYPPDPTNAEIVRVTARSTDTLTIVRAQEGTGARTVLAGDLISNAITTLSITEIERITRAQIRTPTYGGTSTFCVIPGLAVTASSTAALSANTDYNYPIWAEADLTFDQLLLNVSTAGSAGSTGRIAIYNAAGSLQPTGTLIEDFGTFALDSTGNKTMTPSGGSRTISAGMYILSLNLSASASLKSYRGAFPSSPLTTSLSSGPYVYNLTVGRTHAAFPSSPTAWTTVSANTLPFEHTIALRVTAVDW